MATRAGVTESEFRGVFPTLEECYRAAYHEGLARMSRTVTMATDRQARWLERVRSGLVALLGFCDDQPSWARLLLVEPTVSAAVILQFRQQLDRVLTGLLAHPQPAGIAAGSPFPTSGLTDELIVGGVFSVIRTSMLAGDGHKLVELAPSLMAFIVTPYLGQAAAQAELEGSPSEGIGSSLSEPSRNRAQAISRSTDLPVRATYRTTRVLRAIAQAPYSNNREIAQSAGLNDEGQTSKLLARLERSGVIENVGVGPARGEPNAWLLTPAGRHVVELLGAGFRSGAARVQQAGSRGTA